MPTAAQKAEAQGADKRTFKFAGVTYTVDAEVDLDVLELVEMRKNLLAMQAILGPDQWAKFREKHKTQAHLNALYEAYNEDGSGNS